MRESLERLKNFLATEGVNPDQFYEYVRFHEPEAFVDLRRAKQYLLKDLDEASKVSRIVAALEVKCYLVENRKRDKKNAKQKDPYTVYKELYRNGNLSKRDFNEVFALIDAVELVLEEQSGESAAINAVAKWRQLGESDRCILRHLKTLADNSILTFELHRQSEVVNTGVASRKDFEDALRSYGRAGPNGVIGALCALENCGENDASLETAVVYHIATAAFREGDSALVVDPSVAFVRKWMSDECLDRCSVIFVVSDDDVRSVLAEFYVRRRNAEFISAQELYKAIEAEKNPNHIIVFGTKYHNVSELINALDRKENKQYRVSVLAPDGRFFMKGLRDVICNKSICERVVTIFPAGITMATSPQRKLLFQFVVAPEYKNRTLDIAVKAYSLIKGNPQKLQKKILVTKMPLQEYKQGRSFREIYREKEVDALQKTDQKRNVAKEIAFTDEIVINYTAAECADGRCYACAYVRSPKENPLKEIDLQKVTRKSTRRVLRSSVPNWVENEYPYEEIRINGKVVSIREEISRVYRELYQGKSITLKTLVYIYPNVERGMNKREKEQLNKVLCSELGDAQVGGLTRNYIEDALDDLYGTDQCVDERYIALLIIARILEIATQNEHVGTNSVLDDVLKLKRREQRAIGAVRNNLVKNFFTKIEMCRIYDFICKKMNRGLYEYIGILIRLLTGLENNVVCAFKWRDFCRVDDRHCFAESVWQLVVCRKLSKDGREFVYLEKVVENRNIPCSKMLVQILLKERARQLAIFGSEEKLAEQHIVQAKKGMVKNGVVNVLPPNRLSSLGKEVVRAAGIDEHVIQLSTMNDGILEIDLNHYHGDIFRSNFEHWAKKRGRWEEGEIAFVLGREPKTVFSRHYEHLDNLLSQYILMKKQESVSMELIDETPMAVCEKLTWTNLELTESKEMVYSLPVSETERTQVTMEIKTVGTENTCSVFENEHGFDIIVMEV